MGSQSARRLGWVFSVAVMSAVAPGCTRSSDPIVTELPKAEQDLCTIAQAYCRVFARTKKAPMSFDDLRPYLAELGNPDDMLVSPNDGQTYQVMWGADPTKGGGGSVRGMWSIIAYEKVGRNGRRAVADMRGLPTTVTDEEFAQLTFIGGKTPGSL